MKREPVEQRDPLRELVAALAFFGALAALAWTEGVFARLGTTALFLGVFAAGFAALTAWLDRDLRLALKARLPRRKAAAQPVRSAPAKSPAANRAAT